MFATAITGPSGIVCPAGRQLIHEQRVTQSTSYTGTAIGFTYRCAGTN